MSLGRPLQPGFVLHTRPYRETSLLLELFTREHGRLAAVARGARGRRPRWGSALRAFGELGLAWHGRGELASLGAAEPLGPWPRPSGRRLACGLYLNEVLMRLLRRDDPHPELFDSYREAVRALAEGSASEAVVLRVFERDLLAAAGYGLQLLQDATGQPLDPVGWYCYRPEHGPVPWEASAGRAEPGPRLRGAALLALAAGCPDADAARGELRALTRAALQPHLGERPLKSRELYAGMLRSQPEAGQRGEPQ